MQDAEGDPEPASPSASSSAFPATSTSATIFSAPSASGFAGASTSGLVGASTCALVGASTSTFTGGCTQARDVGAEEPDGDDEEREDPFCGDPRAIKRCPEAQVLQTVGSQDPSSGLPSGSGHKVTRRESASNRSFFRVASLPSIQEKPFHDKAFFVESDFPSADTPSSCVAEERERPSGLTPAGAAASWGGLLAPLRHEHRPMALEAVVPYRSHKPQAARPDVYASSSEQERIATRRAAAAAPAANSGPLPILTSAAPESSPMPSLPLLRVVQEDLNSVCSEQSVAKNAEVLAVEAGNESTPTSQPPILRWDIARFSLLDLASAKLNEFAVGRMSAVAIQRTADSIRRLFLASRPRPPLVVKVVDILSCAETPQTSHSGSRIVPLYGSDTTQRNSDASASGVAKDAPAPATSSGIYLQVPTVVPRRLQSDDSWSSVVSSNTSSAPQFDDDVEWSMSETSRTRRGSAEVEGLRKEMISRWGQSQFDRMPSIGSCCCRICQNSSSRERLISPCMCKGSLAYVHLSCLERWLNQSGRTYCELCQYQFNATATPRYGIVRSMRIWYQHPRNRRQLLADLLIAGILTVVTMGLMTVTVVGMTYFVEEGRKLGVAALTTQGTIIFFLVLVGMGYMITMYLLVKDQITPWQQWWRNNVDVRLRLDIPATRA